MWESGLPVTKHPEELETQLIMSVPFLTMLCPAAMFSPAEFSFLCPRWAPWLSPVLFSWLPGFVLEPDPIQLSASTNLSIHASFLLLEMIFPSLISHHRECVCAGLEPAVALAFGILVLFPAVWQGKARFSRVENQG